MGQTSDLLVIILILLIVAVILDGLRRKWRGRGERVVMKLDKSFLRNNNEVSESDEALPNSELPNGGARTVTRTGDVPGPRKPAPRPKPRRQDAAGTTATAADGAEKPAHDAVPVLMDTVELEETTIEHANVFVSAQAPQQFAPELFEDEASSGRVRSNAVEGSEMLDVQMDELEKLGGNGIAPSAGRNPAYDDDEDDFDEDDEDFDDEDDDDEDDWDDEDEDDDDYEEEGEEEGHPRRGRHDEDEDEDDDWDDDDWDDDEDDEDEDEDEDDDEDDDWDDDEDEDEDEQYSGDYENEPTLLEETYARAASHFSRPEPAPEVRIEPGFGDAEEALPVDAADEEVLLEDFNESFLQDEPLFAEPVSGLEPAPETARTGTTPEPEPKGKDGEAARDRTEHLPFFGKSLLGRQQQKELFEEDAQAAAEPAAAEADSAETEGPTEVLIINVMARQGYHFFGEDLLPVLRQQGMQLGEMSIFHRHENADGSGRVVFSMANMVKPGTFDLAQMEQFSTPGLSLFLQLPNRYGNMQSFELMLATANALREGLDGELKDENRSVFTRQTIEHSRQRIRDFELSLLSRK